ncbi:MAG: hypothetical protein F6K00_31270 [Leptolyngbya sp. SIOISBB]|nr:hypothetical protein [Leptolyngbya sp. SIOISBB]
MSCFLSLNTLAETKASQIGESAWQLCRVQQAGQIVPRSWVIPATCFDETLHKLVAREPLFADWPQLLWQPDHRPGYPVQQIARRLHRPLFNLPLNFPWTDLLSAIDTPIVRLCPSLWLGEGIATIPWGQMLAAPLCWAEPEALETALKQVWLSALDAKSLTFWRLWRSAQANTGAHYPATINLAVIVQAVETAAFSGTLTVRQSAVEIAAVEGVSPALDECCPATFVGELPYIPHFAWQAGFQESLYRPRQPTNIQSTPSIEASLYKVSRSQAQLTIPDTVEQQLWSVAQWLTTWSDAPTQIEWSINAESGALHIAQVHGWPLCAYAAHAIAPPTDNPDVITGRAAAPGQGQGRALVLSREQPLPLSAHQQIIIAAEVAPDWLPLLKTARGIVSEQGGLTCHAAVLARELGLPAIIGVQNATERFRPGEALAVDGDRGLINRLPDLPDTTNTPSRGKSSFEPTQTQIWVNLSQPETAAAIAALPLAGVGLLRSEWLMLPTLERQHPYHWLATGQKELLLKRLVKQLRPILEAFTPRPVRYRTLDIRTSEFAQLIGAPAVEPNPMLGARGTFSYHLQPQFFLLELELLKRLQDEGYGNIQLILPFVRTVEEVIHCRSLVETVGLHHHPDFALWMMAEVPSVLFLLPQYVAAGIQGIAIGTHDLTQLLLGIDRDQAIFTAPYDETHPAVQMAIAQLIDKAHQTDIACYLCGASPTHHPEFITAAVQQQIAGISVDVSVLELTTQIIQQAETAMRQSIS